MPLTRNDDIALQLAERMRKDYGPDARTGAVWAWFSRAIHEVREAAYHQGQMDRPDHFDAHEKFGRF